NPVVGLSAYQDWSVLYDAGTIEAPGGTVVPTALLEREREASASLTFRRPRYRSYAWFSAGASVRGVEREWDDPAAPGAQALTLHRVPADVGAAATVGYSRVRSFAFSISPERGYLAAFSAQGRRYR